MKLNEVSLATLRLPLETHRNGLGTVDSIAFHPHLTSLPVTAGWRRALWNAFCML